MKRFKKVAIANRGEVAVRIIRACEEMDLRTVLLHSEPDVLTAAYRMANECVCIGPASSTQSYLNIEAVVAGAQRAGVDALHPGFGFLSENADFSQACADAGITFIGPSPDSIRKMGDKISARKIMMAANVPVSPGYQGDDQTDTTLFSEAQKIGFPLIIKAAAGGGGRGMKVVRSSLEFKELLESARREALSAFGSDRVFFEKYIEGAKHIEFQIFGDQYGNVVHLFERECSVQRRHQKIIEESLSPSLSPTLRETMAKAAVAAAKSAKYVGAGTVEFLLVKDEFYFLEMNTRLQVEHPVTEMVLGVDLVKSQIKVAQGEVIPFTQAELHPRGHAIECRLYAENSYQGGLPSTGLIGAIHFPEGPGRRFEMGFDVGDEVTNHYDPMIGKILVWDIDRDGAIKKMLKVLDRSFVFGVYTNIDFLKAILQHPVFRSGHMNIQFVQQNFPEGLPSTTNRLGRAEGHREEIHFSGPLATEMELKFIEYARAQLSQSQESSVNSTHVSPWNSHWRLL